MDYLYVREDCERCEAIEGLLTDPYQKVMVDNPVIEIGVRYLLGKVVVPLLLRGDGSLWMMGQTSLIRIKQKEAA